MCSSVQFSSVCIRQTTLNIEWCKRKSVEWCFCIVRLFVLRFILFFRCCCCCFCTSKPMFITFNDSFVNSSNSLQCKHWKREITLRVLHTKMKKKTYTHNVVELKIQKLRRRILSKSNFHSFQWCQRERKHIHCICHHKEWIVYICFFSIYLSLPFSLSFCKFAVKSFLLASALCKQVHSVLSVVYKGNCRKVLDDDDDDAKHPVLIVWKQNFHTFFFLKNE